MLVPDASTVVAALVDSGPDGLWAEEILQRSPLAAPHLMPVEVANVLRRSEAAGGASSDLVGQAHRDLLQMLVDLYPYEPVARRVWELRGSLTAYDAWYVAVAEGLDAPLATLDHRLAGASGPRCVILTPD